MQRPDLLQMVSLDLFIVQDLLERGGRSQNAQFADMCNSSNAVISAWAARFIQELGQGGRQSRGRTPSRWLDRWLFKSSHVNCIVKSIGTKAPNFWPGF